MALRIFISGDKFPAGGKTYIENYPAIDEVRSGIELAVIRLHKHFGLMEHMGEVSR